MYCWRLLRRLWMPIAVCAQMQLCCCSQHFHHLSRNHRPPLHDETLSSYTEDMYVSSSSATGQCISDEKLKIQETHIPDRPHSNPHHLKVLLLILGYMSVDDNILCVILIPISNGDSQVLQLKFSIQCCQLHKADDSFGATRNVKTESVMFLVTGEPGLVPCIFFISLLHAVTDKLFKVLICQSYTISTTNDIVCLMLQKSSHTLILQQLQAINFIKECHLV